MDILFMILLAVVAIIALSLILGSFFTVNTAQVAVITRFGKFLRVADAGLNWKMPYFDSVAGIMSLRVNQITLTMETKTKDNVFVTIPISVQNRVRAGKSLRRLLQAVRSGGADQVLCGAGDSGPCAGNDAGRCFRQRSPPLPPR